ncbi:MAG: F0F1 ATP synthase subunit epsilon [Thermodesulfovibrionales bacterium]|nr:F0F1 ATP synthase subunit epsilon [Thermodesulfovibrionales bacterium]
MENKIRLDIVTPYGLVYSEDVDEVTATGSEGEFGILPGHAPFITTLKIGMLAAKKGAGLTYFFVNWGYAEVDHEKIMVIADSAEVSTHIDVERAQAAKQRAEERLRKEGDVDFTRAEAALQRALIRMQVAEKRQLK